MKRKNLSKRIAATALVLVAAVTMSLITDIVPYFHRDTITSFYTSILF